MAKWSPKCLKRSLEVQAGRRRGMAWRWESREVACLAAATASPRVLNMGGKWGNWSLQVWVAELEM